MAVLATLSAALAGRYEIERQLGQGGMAEVYVGRDLRVGRRVAIKVLRPEVAQAVGAERFLREVEIAAGLQHPHILPLFDSDQADGLLYYVMPLVEGETLRERLRREVQLPIAEALRIARQVADALDYAHGQGVVHRDIKPENLLLSGDRTYVADFGVARLAEAAGSKWRSASGTATWRTETGIVVGTLGYMSPEQATATAQLDGRSDQYALACVVYEMLAGETPFQGASLQIMVSKLLTLLPPSVRIVRDKVPGLMDESLQRALSRTPADRFRTCGEFVAALAREPGWRHRLIDRAGTRRGKVALATVATIGAAFALWRLVPGSGTGPAADPNRVVVFPMSAAEPELNQAGAGWNLALAVTAALEHAQPLKAIDGWSRLAADLRQDPRRLTADVALQVSRDRGAAYYLTGAIGATRDSLAVSLVLHDVTGDSVVAQETAFGPRTDGGEILALDALTRLLPKWVPTGARFDLSAFTGRRPSAIALAAQGDREYRLAHFRRALEFYRRAVAEDSASAFAAVKGAQAASWENLYPEARELVAVAAAHDSLLPAKYRHFTRAWAAYLSGDGDSALTGLEAALAVDPEWGEAAMALGEVHYHLLPSQPGLDTLAQRAFERVLRTDSLFVPSLFHLSEIAIRAGDLRRADRLIARLHAAGPDSSWLAQLTVMRDCVRAREGEYRWAEVAAADAGTALLAAKALTAGAAQPACAVEGFAAVLRSASASAGNRWGALLGLQGLLLATGRYDEARRMLDSARAAGSRGVYSVYVFDELAGAPLGPQAAVAESLARAGAGELYSAAQLSTRWLLGVWNVRRGRYPTAEGVIRELEAGEGDGRAALVAGLLRAHLAAARGDSTGASRLAALIDQASAGGLAWDLTGPMAPERHLLAELLLAQGRLAEAEQVASAFDHQEPIAFLPYLPASLTIRLRAARASGRREAAKAYADRLRRLGWADRVAALEQESEITSTGGIQ